MGEHKWSFPWVSIHACVFADAHLHTKMHCYWWWIVHECVWGGEGGGNKEVESGGMYEYVYVCAQVRNGQSGRNSCVHTCVRCTQFIHQHMINEQALSVPARPC